MNLVMFVGRQSIREKKDSLNWLKVMRRTTFGIWTRQVCFGRLYQIVDSEAKESSAREAKKSKQRVTIAFFVTAAGKKEKPIFIWKAENPRCLSRFEKITSASQLFQ